MSSACSKHGTQESFSLWLLSDQIVARPSKGVEESGLLARGVVANDLHSVEG